MKQYHDLYHSIRTWKIVKQANYYAIVPSPDSAFLGPVICLPLFAVFYWLVNYKIHGISVTALIIADVIIIGLSLLMLAVSLYIRADEKSDMRPFLEVSLKDKLISLPRANLELSLNDQDYFIAHKVVTSLSARYSEIDLIRMVNGQEQHIPILQCLGINAGFDKIGRDLETLKIPFRSFNEKPCSYRQLLRSSPIS